MKTKTLTAILAYIITLPDGIHRINIHGHDASGQLIIAPAPKGQTSGGWTVSSTGELDRELVSQAEGIADEYALSPA